MAFSSVYNHAGLPAITDYAHAQSIYEGIRPIRGRAKDVRPLGRERRYDQYRIVKRISANQFTNAETVSYACVLYQTDCVTFHPDNTITVKHDGWTSMTTRGFMRYILAQYGDIDSQRGKWYFVNRKGDAFLMGRELKLKIEDGIVVPVVEQPVEYRHSIRRKVMNQLRKKYAFFYEYGKVMLALDRTVTRLEVAEASHGLDFANLRFLPYLGQYYYNPANREKPEQIRAKLFKALDSTIEQQDPALLYELASAVAHTAGNYSYQRNATVCSPERFKTYLDEIIKYEFCEEVFEKTAVPTGSVFFDENAKYFVKTK